MTLRAGNREPLWDKTGEVPSAFARELREPSLAARVERFFYKRLQYAGSVDQSKRNERQPVPVSRNVLSMEAKQEGEPTSEEL
jgi:hypothetical protein